METQFGCEGDPVARSEFRLEGSDGVFTRTDSEPFLGALRRGTDS